MDVEDGFEVPLFEGEKPESERKSFGKRKAA